jgi:hypothetical protein
MMTEGPSRPRDANQLAKRIVDLATGAETEEKTAPLTPAQEFARSGGLKGGAARAASNRDDPIKQRIFQQPARARLRRLDELPISQRLIREAHQRLMTGVTTDRGAHIEPGQFSSTRQLLKHPLPHSAFGPAHEAMTNAFSKARTLALTRYWAGLYTLETTPAFCIPATASAPLINTLILPLLIVSPN